mgnify:FL=1
MTADWEAIAAAFPHLTMTAQCVDEEGEGSLAAEWRIADGKVEYNPESTERIAMPRDLSEGTILGHVLGIRNGSERGVSVERLRRAVARVAGAVK